MVAKPVTTNGKHETAWITTLYASLVFTEIDALNKRSISIKRASSGIATEWAEVVCLLQVPGS